MFHQEKKHVATFESIKTLHINQDVIECIRATIGSDTLEQGGIIGGFENNITHYYWDKSAKCTCKEYTPSLEDLNKQIELWADKSVEFLGIVHSHPRGYNQLSPSDICMANQILKNAPDLSEIYLLIVEILENDITIHGFHIA